jgi:hypothetical protein
VAVLTGVLVWRTGQYVSKTQKLADEAKRTNDLSAANFERSIRLEAPSLEIRPGPLERGETRDPNAVVIQELSIKNTGRTAASHVYVETTWGTVELMEPSIAPGETTFTHVTLPLAAWNQDGVYVTRSLFFDIGGTRWFQSPSELPRPLPGDYPYP